MLPHQTNILKDKEMTRSLQKNSRYLCRWPIYEAKSVFEEKRSTSPHLTHLPIFSYRLHFLSSTNLYSRPPSSSFSLYNYLFPPIFSLYIPFPRHFSSPHSFIFHLEFPGSPFVSFSYSFQFYISPIIYFSTFPTSHQILNHILHFLPLFTI